MLDEIRSYLKDHALDGIIIPRADHFQGEYVRSEDAQLAAASGFTGSAGLSLILREQAYLFVDGRYTLQAHEEAFKGYTIESLSNENFVRILESHQSLKLGFNGWLFTAQQIADWKKRLPNHQWVLSSWSVSLPREPHGIVFNYSHAGEPWQDKLKRFQSFLHDKKIQTFILFNVESLSWLLNIRAHHVPHVPVVHGFARLHAHEPIEVYTDLILPDLVLDTLKDVKFYKEEEFLKTLKNQTHDIYYDFTQAPYICAQNISKGHHIKDPSILWRATKNKDEQNGAYDAHIRDGAAVCTFFSHFYEDPLSWNEITIEQELLKCRQAQDLFAEPSFDTIAGINAHGAIIHYRASQKTNITMTSPGMLLLDSGGQYLDGTTDVTRTISIGQPTPEQKRHFTWVLKGHIALATAIFPRGTTGTHLDVLARQYLWQQGLDFPHGTGHGVGCFLSVHEGPQRISKALISTPLEEGMILSNEPGYYVSHQYGIRIENLMLVKSHLAYKDFLYFDTLTLVPLDVSLMDLTLMTPQEIEWVNSYHSRVKDFILPKVNEKTKQWIYQATSPLHLPK